MYAINFDHTDGRILSATTEEFLAPGMTTMEELPEGDITDYRIVDGEYVYDPLPNEYPKAEKDILPDEVFSLGADFFRARIGIARGEAITRYNADPVSLVEIVNALHEAQKGN